MIPKQIDITEENQKWLDNSCINLSKFVRRSLDREAVKEKNLDIEAAKGV